MSKFPWKTALAGAAIVTVAGYAFAAQLSPGGGPMKPYGQAQGMPEHGGVMGPMHSQMVQGHGGIGAPGVMNGHQFGAQAGRRGIPTMPGQEAFGTIQEIVSMLEADPSTDWSKVDIAALREHLIDMNEVTLHAVAQERIVDGGIEIAVTGAGRTLTAIRHMVPAHVSELRKLGWNAKTEELPDGVKLTVLANGAVGLARLKALGFMGIMVQGAHHQVHHLMMAKGEMAVH
jgi:hypothetical protein